MSHSDVNHFFESSDQFINQVIVLGVHLSRFSWFSNVFSIAYICCCACAKMCSIVELHLDFRDHVQNGLKPLSSNWCRSITNSITHKHTSTHLSSDICCLRSWCDPSIFPQNYFSIAHKFKGHIPVQDRSLCTNKQIVSWRWMQALGCQV